mgnify:CR=1 FL=1
MDTLTTDPRPSEHIATTAEALADVVDAYRKVVRLSRTQPRSRNWRTAYGTYCDASVRYSALSGLAPLDVAAKVHSIAECFSS